MRNEMANPRMYNIIAMLLFKLYPTVRILWGQITQGFEGSKVPWES